MDPEEILTYAQAARKIPSGNVSPEAIYRWTYRGLQTPEGHQVILKTVKIGKARATTLTYLREFLAATSGGAGVGAMEAQPEDGACLCRPNMALHTGSLCRS